MNDGFLAGDEITRREALKRGAIFGGAALVWVQPSVQTFGMSATLAAQASGSAGCTPGFWKNNPGRWPSSVSPDDLVPWTGTEIGRPTFAEALAFGGGGGLAGAERALFRAAAAGYLNARALGGYAYSSGELSTMVNGAIASMDRATILSVKDAIDTENNAGCPLPADESPEEVVGVEEANAEDGVYGRPEEETSDEPAKTADEPAETTSKDDASTKEPSKNSGGGASDGDD